MVLYDLSLLGHYPCVPCVHGGGRPNATEFGTFLRWFLHDGHRANCTIGGYPDFRRAVRLTPDMKAVASKSVWTDINPIHRSLKKQQKPYTKL